MEKASQALAEAQTKCTQISELAAQVGKLSELRSNDEQMNVEPEEVGADLEEGVQEDVNEENEAQAEGFRRAQTIHDIITQVNFEEVLTLFGEIRDLNSQIGYQEEIKVSCIFRSNSEDDFKSSIRCYTRLSVFETLLNNTNILFV